MPILELTDEQLYIVKESCDLYARIRTGHFDVIWSILAFDCEKNCKQPLPSGNLWHAIAEVIQKFWFPELPNYASNYGIGHDVQADRAWTINEAIREYYYKQNEGNNGINDYFRAMNWVDDEKMPEVRTE